MLIFLPGELRAGSKLSRSMTMRTRADAPINVRRGDVRGRVKISENPLRWRDWGEGVGVEWAGGRGVGMVSMTAMTKVRPKWKRNV